MWLAAGFEDTELGCFWNRRVGMERRKFSREFRLEAAKLVVERVLRLPVESTEHEARESL